MKPLTANLAGLPLSETGGCHSNSGLAIRESRMGRGEFSLQFCLPSAILSLNLETRLRQDSLVRVRCACF